MSRKVAKRDLTPTLSAATRWMETCLIEDGSILSGSNIWTLTLVAECRVAFVEHPDEGEDDFMTKLKGQMKTASSEAQRLMAEMLWALLLFPSNIRATTKRQHVRSIWGLSGQPLDETSPALRDEVLRGIGSGGPGFNNHRWRELVFLISLTESLKRFEPNQRRQVFSDYDKFMDWIESVPREGYRQFRHMLRYFAFPDHVERMSSGRDRHAVLEGYGIASHRELEEWSDKQVDEALLSLRKSLEAQYPEKILDFYEPPLDARWRHEDEADNEEPEEGDAFTGPHVWIEKTIVRGRADREAGEYSLGKMLWSPQRGKNGGDIYRSMREVQSGDAILHLTDNEGFTGVSVADSRAEEFQGLPGTAWGNRPSYRIRLRDYVRLDPPLRRETFFREPYLQRLRGLIDGGLQRTFYNREPALNQGAYLTPAPPELVAVLNDAYLSVAGKPLVTNGRVPSSTTSVPTTNENLAAIMASFAEGLRRAYLDFGPDHDSLIRAFISSLAAKRFAILTGLSGSGKSQIAIKFGQWVGPHSYKLIAVRPDWTGPESLFGYEDALKRSKDGKQGWHVPDALAFMLRAARNPDKPYVLILGEMNLAHVERYFADALSGIETSEPCVPNLSQGADAVWTVTPDGPSKIPFPRNLFVIGTVNVDETTYLFSPKVLDRGNTFEFRVDTDALSAEARKPEDVVPGPEDLVRGFLSIARKDDWHLLHPAPWLSAYTKYLRTLHLLLAESSLEFGHRVYYEAARFAALHAASGGQSMEEALDRQVMQKVLPRIHGSRKKVEAALCALGQFALELKYVPGSARPGAQVAFDLTKPSEPAARLPLSLSKIRRMVLTLGANQFTSFTD